MRSARTVMTPALLWAMGCGATPLASSSSDAPAATGTGGALATGVPSHPGTGGQTPGIVKGTGGAPAVTCPTPPKVSGENCGSPSAAVGSFRGHDSAYRALGSFAGFAYVFISPTPNPSDTFVCGSSFAPAIEDREVVGEALCGAGTVPADCTGNAVGAIGFNLNQPSWGYGSYDNGYTQPTRPITEPDPVSSVTVTFVNRANSELRIQIAQDSASGSIYYCRDITGVQSPVTVAANQFATTCWDSVDPGVTWDGTGAESIALIIPSRKAQASPFDACIQDVHLD